MDKNPWTKKFLKIGRFCACFSVYRADTHTQYPNFLKLFPLRINIPLALEFKLFFL